jgi:endonuclease/exonuclease/phosphatase family metal-dependent hydrolase
MLLWLALMTPWMPADAALSLLTYNIAGNGTTNWTTNSLQIQALGRELVYLNPDIITFNEVPYSGTTNMTNIVTTYLPGYHVVVSPKGDNFIHNAIASRYPIVGSASYLNGTTLTNFGYTGTSKFTRDLFQAAIQVPSFSQPVDVFVVHLKATTSDPNDDAARRAAEASAVSNFIANVYLPTNSGRFYTLSGDMNEDIYRPETNHYTSGQPIQRLVAPATGLRLTMPVNPFTPPTNNDLTESIRGSLSVRFDYIMPCPALFSNIAASQVFRTDLLIPTPAGLLSNDDRTASDHLPVLMVFNNPEDVPFQITSVNVTNQVLTMRWQSINGRRYQVDASPDLQIWTPFATNLTATGPQFTFSTNVATEHLYFRVYRVP